MSHSPLLFYLQPVKREIVFTPFYRGRNKDPVRFRNFPKIIELRRQLRQNLKQSLWCRTTKWSVEPMCYPSLTTCSDPSSDFTSSRKPLWHDPSWNTSPELSPSTCTLLTCCDTCWTTPRKSAFRSAVAGDRERGRHRLEKGTRRLLGKVKMFIVLIVVMVLWVYFQCQNQSNCMI